MINPPPLAGKGFEANHADGTKPEVIWRIGGRIGTPGAGMMQMAGAQFEGMPPNWMSYLSVADCDATVARARGLGAQVIVPPQDVPNLGRFSVLRDPTGAVFAIMFFAPRK
jgi:predicted enzyme related to lactoylglutathione lyase